MEIQAYCENSNLFVKLDGEIDHHSATDIRQKIDEMILKNRPHCLVADLSDIDFMDSSGLGLVLGRFRKMKDIKGNMIIVNPSDRILCMLKMCGVDKLIKIVSSQGEKS